jgi:hypothetical protein
MYMLLRQMAQLWHPPAHIRTTWVGIPSVAHWMTVDADKPLRDACRALVLPHHRIDGQIAVCEGYVKPLLTVSPITSKAFDKELAHRVP